MEPFIATESSDSLGEPLFGLGVTHDVLPSGKNMRGLTWRPLIRIDMLVWLRIRVCRHATSRNSERPRQMMAACVRLVAPNFE